MTDTIAKIKSELKNILSPDDSRLPIWRQDTRAGVQKAIHAWDKKQEKQRIKLEKFYQRFEFEKNYWQQNMTYVAGVDEVGRGPLAGPVVAAAVILPHDFVEVDVIDSKQLSAEKRDILYNIIIDQAVSIGIGVVDVETIDRINIYEAARLAMTYAVKELAPEPDALLIDAMTVHLDVPQESLIKGDARSNSIGAASIIAKVTRDRMMSEYDSKYPGYGFAQNAGYGTTQHLEALKVLGITDIHRRSFKPVQEYID